MKVSQEEKLKYRVMRAIFESRIPIDFKGAMVLRAYLHENGFVGEVRRTMDISPTGYRKLHRWRNKWFRHYRMHWIKQELS